MTASDLVLIAALALFAVAWWVRAFPARRPVLWGSALVALVAGAWGVWDDRWQAIVGAVAGLLLLIVLALTGRRAHRRRGIPYISGPLVTLPVVVAVAALAFFPVPDLPKPAGPYAVGVRNFELTDASRRGVLGAPADQPRRLLVRVWYPAEPQAGADTAPYFTDVEARTTAYGLGSLLGFPPMLSYLKHVATHSVAGAPLHAGSSRLPVIVYSHGYTSFAGQNTVLMEDLASHGYVVVSIQHSGDASDAVLPDGTIVPMDPALFADEGGGPPLGVRDAFAGADVGVRLNGMLQYREHLAAKTLRIAARSAPAWVADTVFVLDRLQAGEVPPDIAPIAAAGDFSRTGQVGMSFGGSAAGGFCMVDRRCAAGINMDGLSYDLSTLDATVPVPFMMLHADLAAFSQSMTGEAPPPPDQVRSFNEFAYERFDEAGQAPNIFRFQVLGARHMGYSDFPLFIRRPVRDEFLGTVPAETMIALQNDMVRGFFDRFVKGEANDFPVAERERYSDWLKPVGNGALRDWWLAQPQAKRQEIEARIEALKAAR